MRCASTGFLQCACTNEFERGARVDELMRVSVGFCVARAHKGFVQCACADELMPLRRSRVEPVRLVGGCVCK